MENKTEVVAGIDIGGTNTKFGLVDKKGTCFSEGSIPTNSDRTIEDFVLELAKQIKSALQAKPNLELKGIGIGVPNGNYYKGTIEHAANLKWKGVVPMAKLFKNHFDVPVTLTNDANAAAIGEMVYGGARFMNDFIVITLGTGLGSGIVSNGKLIYGHDGFAGELGHTIVRHNGRQCGCGRNGCLETYASATGIRRTVFELLSESMEETPLRNVSFNDLTSDKIAEAALKGDSIAKEAFEYTGELLGQKLADSVAHTSPEAIFLFGGLAKSGDLILKPTQRSLEKHLLPIYRNKIKVLISQMGEINAAVLGAGALVWKEIEQN